MEPITILLIEDEAEVMDALLHDLQDIEQSFPIEVASSVEEAKGLLEELIEEEKPVGLILSDHILPGENGVEFLVELAKQEETRFSRKVLVTGQASHQDTIKAVNSAGLHHYIAKPWQKEELLSIVKEQLSLYIINRQLDPMPYLSILQSEQLMEYIRQRGLNAGAE
jgi:response regulator RpfG family c-di-GMP phosphodiesterase